MAWGLLAFLGRGRLDHLVALFNGTARRSPGRGLTIRNRFYIR
jgi:hypothetical protein